METYLLIKLIHILSATILFGTGLGTAFFMWRAHRSGDLQAMAVVARNVVRADTWFTAPAVVVQPLSGIWLAHRLGLSLDTPWILTSLLLYTLVGCCWFPVVFIQTRVARRAEAMARGEPAAAIRHLMRWWYALGWPAFIAVLVIFYLMVFRPALW